MTYPTHIVAVGGIVEDDDGNILLVKTFARGWEYPGGQVEAQENLIDALCREVKEESGIDINVKSLVGIYSNTKIKLNQDGSIRVPTKVMLDFICTPVGGKLATSNETTDVQWVKKENVLDLITHPAYITRFKQYLAFNGTVKYMEYTTGNDFNICLDRLV